MRVPAMTLTSVTMPGADYEQLRRRSELYVEMSMALRYIVDPKGDSSVGFTANGDGITRLHKLLNETERSRRKAVSELALVAIDVVGYRLKVYSRDWPGVPYRYISATGTDVQSEHPTEHHTWHNRAEALAVWRKWRVADALHDRVSTLVRVTRKAKATAPSMSAKENP